jgi:hypothetical protein
VAAASVLADIPMAGAPNGTAEVAKALGKALPRKVRKTLPDLVKPIVSSAVDAAVWERAARQSLARVSFIATGDATLALADTLGVAPDAVAKAAVGDPRAEALLQFAVSSECVDARRVLGLSQAPSRAPHLP